MHLILHKFLCRLTSISKANPRIIKTIRQEHGPILFTSQRSLRLLALEALEAYGVVVEKPLKRW